MVNRTIEKLLILFNTAIGLVLAAWIVLPWVKIELVWQIRDLLWNLGITPYKLWILIGIGAYLLLSGLFLFFNRLPNAYSSVYVYNFSKKRKKLSVSGLNKAARDAAKNIGGIKSVKAKIMLGQYGSQLHIDMKTKKNLDFVEVTKEYCTELIALIKERFGIKFPSYKLAQGKYAYEYSLPESMPQDSAHEAAAPQEEAALDAPLEDKQEQAPQSEPAAQKEAEQQSQLAPAAEQPSAQPQAQQPAQPAAQPAVQQPAMPEPAMPAQAPDAYGTDYPPANDYYGDAAYGQMDNPLDIYSDSGPYLNTDMNPYMEQPDPLANDPYADEYMANNPYASYGADDLPYESPEEDMSMQHMGTRMTPPVSPRYMPPSPTAPPMQPASSAAQSRVKSKLPLRKGMPRGKGKSDIYDRINAIIDKYTKPNGNNNK